MTSEPGVISTSLIEFGQSGDYHTHSMTEAKEAAGFAPLETLPAEWYNNYIYKLDSHINRLQTVTRQMQVELACVISSTSVEPSDTSLNQVNTAIQKKIADAAPGIATGSIAGVVTSSAAWSAVSVDPTTGVMTPNALCDWEPIYNPRTGTCFSTLASWLGPLAECKVSGSTLAYQLSCLKEAVLPLNDWDSSIGTVDQLTVPDRQCCIVVTDCYRFSLANMYNDTLNRPGYIDGLSLAYNGCADNLNRELSLYAVSLYEGSDDSSTQLLSYCYCAASQKHTAVVGQWLACMYPDSCISLYTISQDCLDPNETQAAWCMSTMNMNSINTRYARCCTRSSDSCDSCVCYWQSACTNGTLATTLNYGVDNTSEYWYKTYNTIYNCGDSNAVFDNTDFRNALAMYGVNIRSYVCSSLDDASCGSCVLLCSGVRAAVLGSDLALCSYTEDSASPDSIWCNANITLVGTCSHIGNECTVDGTIARNMIAVGHNNHVAVYLSEPATLTSSMAMTASVFGVSSSAVTEVCVESTDTHAPFTGFSLAIGHTATAYVRVEGTKNRRCRASAVVGAIGNCVTACSYYDWDSTGEGRSLFVAGNNIYAIQTKPHLGVFVFASHVLTVSNPNPINGGAVGVMITSEPGYGDVTFADLRCALYDALGRSTDCSNRNITLHGSGQVGMYHTAISCILFTTSRASVKTFDNQSVNFDLTEYANVVQLMGVVSYQLT